MRGVLSIRFFPKLMPLTFYETLNNNQRLQEFSKLFLGLMPSTGRVAPRRYAGNARKRRTRRFFDWNPVAWRAMAGSADSGIFRVDLETTCVSRTSQKSQLRADLSGEDLQLAARFS